MPSQNTGDLSTIVQKILNRLGGVSIKQWRGPATPPPVIGEEDIAFWQDQTDGIIRVTFKCRGIQKHITSRHLVLLQGVLRGETGTSPHAEQPQFIWPVGRTGRIKSFMIGTKTSVGAPSEFRLYKGKPSWAVAATNRYDTTKTVTASDQLVASLILAANKTAGYTTAISYPDLTGGEMFWIDIATSAATWFWFAVEVNADDV